MPVWRKGIAHQHVGSYTVANLPTTTTLRTLAPGDQAYATNGRAGGQAAGAGTGVLCYLDSVGWKAVDTGAAVAA